MRIPIELFEKASWTELITATVVVLFFTIVLLQVFSSTSGKKVSRKRGDIALIIGPCGAGKTTLYYKWSLPGQKVKTVTSQTALRGKVLTGSSLEIVDYPGHPRLRHGAHALLPRAQKIVFLLDATSDDFKSVSEQLYDLLVAKELRADAKLLLCRNKTESSKARSESTILKALNDEIEKLRHARSQHLDGENADLDQYLGVSDEVFDIKAHCPVDVAFGSVSAMKGNIADIESFLAQ